MWRIQGPTTGKEHPNTSRQLNTVLEQKEMITMAGSILPSSFCTVERCVAPWTSRSIRPTRRPVTNSYTNSTFHRDPPLALILQPIQILSTFLNQTCVRHPPLLLNPLSLHPSSFSSPLFPGNTSASSSPQSYLPLSLEGLPLS